MHPFRTPMAVQLPRLQPWIRVLQLVLLCVTPSDPARAETPLFDTRAGFVETKTVPTAIATGDLNRDGRADVAFTQVFAHTIAILLGNGDGTFGAQRDYAIAGFPKSVAIADLNGDHSPDLAVSSSGTSVYILLGNGDGTLRAPIAFDAGVIPANVVIADLNRDGFLDVASPNFQGFDVSVLFGRGDGSFGARQTIAIGREPDPLLVSDLNGDSAPDLVAGGAIFLNNGDGSFRAGTSIAPDAAPVAIGDLDGDGKPDLLLANFRRIWKLTGNGDGTFKDKTEIQAIQSTTLAIGNLDDHPGLDMVVATWGDSLHIFSGDGKGGFERHRVVAAGSVPTIIARGDLRGSGRDDLIVGDSGCTTIAILLSNPDGSFGSTLEYGTAFGLISCTIGDLDGDGHLDFVLANPDSDRVSILYGRGDGTFGSRRDLDVGLQPVTTTIGDVNQDGHPDLLVANWDEWSISVFLGDGVRGFLPRFDFPARFWPSRLVIRDFNRDGHPDLAVQNHNGMSIFLGVGDGHFGSEMTNIVRTGDSMAFDDVNEDGKLDALFTDGFGLTVLIGKGDGTFPVRWAVGAIREAEVASVSRAEANTIATADLDGDGHRDLVVPEWVFFGDGGGFFRREPMHVACDARAIEIADLDADGREDVVVENGSNFVSVLFGRGDGTFGPRSDFGTGIDPASMKIADLDGDTIPDILVANRGSNSISVLRNRIHRTASVIEDLQASVDGDRVRLSWRLSGGAWDLGGVIVQRAEAADGPFEDRTSSLLEPSSAMSFDDVAERPASYWYRLVLSSAKNLRTPSASIQVTVGILEPLRTALYPPKQNNGTFTISYSISTAATHIRLAIYDVRGRWVRDLIQRIDGRGAYSLTWTGRDAHGARVPRGVYLLRLQAGSVSASCKLLQLHG